MAFRFVPPLSDADHQALMATYTYGEKLALRRRAHAIVLSHQGHTIDQICKILSVIRETVSLWFDAWEAQASKGSGTSHALHRSARLSTVIRSGYGYLSSPKRNLIS
ncbi:hypothetical protein HALA3H3_250023 [Halomonas sp. A3H3]|nr:hypothetical protein HALA3H3_250023 [Halomonas sp. A3H3]